MYNPEITNKRTKGLSPNRNNGIMEQWVWGNGVMMKSLQSRNLKWITSFYNNIPLFHHSIIPSTKFVARRFRIIMFSISYIISETFNYIIYRKKSYITGEEENTWVKL